MKRFVYNGEDLEEVEIRNVDQTGIVDVEIHLKGSTYIRVEHSPLPFQIRVRMVGGDGIAKHQSVYMRGDSKLVRVRFIETTKESPQGESYRFNHVTMVIAEGRLRRMASEVS